MSGKPADGSPALEGRDGKSALLRTAFWFLLLTVFVLSAWPLPLEPPYAPSDKVQHALAFLSLGILGGAAYPRLPLLRLALGLAAFGALIEAVQAIPMLNRQTEFLDWIADIAGIAPAIAALAAWRSLRRKG
jgi:hypothetical protein